MQIDLEALERYARAGYPLIGHPALALIAKVRELERDAARYRYLRDEHIGDDPEMINLPRGKRPGLDAAIDAARGGKE